VSTSTPESAIDDRRPSFRGNHLDGGPARLSGRTPGSVGCCRTAPRLVSRVDAPYRSVANARHLHGIAIIELIIDPNHVCAARILRGLDPAFDRAAIVAVKQWTFRPALSQAGKPVTVVFNVTARAD